MKRNRHSQAFTLVEIMVATGIFFMAMFALLGVMSAGVHAAAILRNSGPTAGMIAAQMTVSNTLEEGSLTGVFSDIPIYQDYHWVSNCQMVTTNGLFKMDFVVFNASGVPVSTLSTLLYRPDSKPTMGVR
jgi:type II secretory pathway pseudopilin PulG